MRPRHVLAAVLVAAIWGFNFVVIDAGLDNFPPLLFAALRFVVVAVPLVLLVPRPRVPWRWFAYVGVPIGVGQFGLLFIGMQEGMPPGLASLVLQTQALFTALIAGVLLRERLGMNHAIGLVIAFTGMTLIGLDFGQNSPVLAFVLCIFAAASWGLANVAIRRMNQVAAKPVDAFAFIIWMSLVPPLPLLVLSGIFEGVSTGIDALGNVTLVGLGAVAYIAFVSTIGGFGIWGWLIRRYNAGTVAMYSLLVPPFGMASAALVLDENFSTVRLGASVLVIAGVAIASLQRQVVGPTAAPEPNAGSLEPAAAARPRAS
jgi:O-acetylserine/cysteine efflux transporter